MTTMADRIAARKLIEDEKSLAARRYLAAELPLGCWATVSKNELGRSHAFLQQYIRRGKPRLLGETDRNTLVRLYDLDPDMLLPPSPSVGIARSGKKRRGQPHRINAPRGDHGEDAGKTELLWFWAQLTAVQCAFVLSMLAGALDRAWKPAVRDDDAGSMAA